MHTCISDKESITLAKPKSASFTMGGASSVKSTFSGFKSR